MKAYWFAYLSDGQCVSEKDLYEEDNQTNPWLRMMEYLKKNGITVSSVQLIVNGRVYNTPSITNRGKFYCEGEPCNLWCQKRFNAITFGEYEENLYYGISYKVGDYRHYLWVNVENNESFVEIKNCNGLNERYIDQFYE